MKKWAIVLVYLLFSLTLILLYLPVNDLHPDEAHYWVWSTRPQAGYFDNAPLIAFFIRASTAVLGRNETGVRFPAALAFVLLGVLLYSFALRVTGKRPVALLSTFLLLSMPIIMVGSHIITHDTPMMIFAGLTWLFLYQALVEKKQTRWYLVGLFFGLALLAKYQAVLIGVSALILMLVHRDFRSSSGGKSLTSPS